MRRSDSAARYEYQAEYDGQAGAGSEYAGCQGKTEQVRQDAAHKHAHQTSYPVQSVVQAHKIAAVALGRHIENAVESAESEQCPGRSPQTAQHKPYGETVRNGVPECGDGGEHCGDEDARPVADALIQPSYRRIKRQAHQPVRGQYYAYLP